MWGIDPKDVFAFGDMPGDLEVLHWAGFGVAMGDAHPTSRPSRLRSMRTTIRAGLAQILERWF